MKMKKLTTIALAAAMAAGTFGLSVPAKASPATTSTDYTITIPAKLDVANAGWNETDGITAKWTKTEGVDSFDTGKKLTVTAASGNTDWTLKSGDNSVGYNLATATGTYSSAAETPSWEFLAEELNKKENETVTGTTKPMGIIVDDYSTKPAGSYTDTVTFTAKVEDAGSTLAGVTLTDGIGVVIKYNVSGNNTVYFKYVAASDTFVPDYASYDETMGSKYAGSHAGSIVDQNWNGGSNNFYFRKNGNTAHVYGNDGISMQVFDIQFDFDNMTYTQSYKEWYKAASGSFSSIKIGDTTITASQMTVQ